MLRPNANLNEIAHELEPLPRAAYRTFIRALVTIAREAKCNDKGWSTRDSLASEAVYLALGTRLSTWYIMDAFKIHWEGEPVAPLAWGSFCASFMRTQQRVCPRLAMDLMYDKPDLYAMLLAQFGGRRRLVKYAYDTQELMDT